MRRTTMAGVAAVLVTAVSAIAPAARSMPFQANATPPPLATGWVPSNAGVLWWHGNDPSYPLSLPRQPPGEVNGAWYITRRIAISPHLPGVMHMGSLFHGMYTSVGGGGWATLSPGCWLPVNPPQPLGPAAEQYRIARRALIGLNGLDACGIEGIAYDPWFPNRIYAAAYDTIKLDGFIATLGDGGVYVSDNLGLSWRKLLGGVRGNAIAVHRTSVTQATIAVGYIQVQSPQQVVGPTPDNGSISISHDDGRTWRNVSLPASGCPDVPNSSQRITPTIAISPTDPDRIFAGTNAGLYDTSDGGDTWTLRRLLCGGVWGIALSRDGGTIYMGDYNGGVSSSPTTPSQWNLRPIVTLGAGRVQSVLLDPLDPSENTLYAASWWDSAANGRVHRINVRDRASARLDDDVFRDLIPLDQAWPGQVPKPFPLAIEMANGAAPSLFLARSPTVPGALYVSTLVRGAFVRLD